MDGFGFSTDVTVRFAETDAQGVAHNSVYLVWFEVARVAYLERYAGGYQALRDQGLESFVLESHVRYRLPARFDDRLRIHARVSELRGSFGEIGDMRLAVMAALTVSDELAEARRRIQALEAELDGARKAQGTLGARIAAAESAAALTLIQAAERIERLSRAFAQPGPER